MARKAGRATNKRRTARGKTRKTGTRSGARASRATTRASSAARRSAGRAKRPGQGATRRKRAATGKAAGTRGGGKVARKRATPAKGSAATRRDSGRHREEPHDLTDVTVEVQDRYDAEDDDVPTPPSTLDLDRHASAARTGHERMAQRRRKHTAASPEVTGGDVDADWEQAYFAGDESATADNPTPDQSDVGDIGRAVGVDYEDNEELKSTPKVERRDRKRWELDPASSEDYRDRNRKK